MGKIGIITKFYRTDLFICSRARERKILTYSQINMVDCFLFCFFFLGGGGGGGEGWTTS